MRFDRRLLFNFDWILLLTVLAIAGLGIMNLYSASTGFFGGERAAFHVKQAVWLCAGLGVALFLTIFDYRHLQSVATPLYLLVLLLLAAVLVIGKTSMGATRWLNLGFFNLQPSEILKVIIIITLARFFSEQRIYKGYTLVSLAVPLALVLVPVGMVMKQPDLGTSLVVIFIAASMVLFARIKRGTLIFFVTTGLTAAGIGWNFLHDYQRKRVLTFLNPERDPLGSGYHIIQSKIAVGSGGFWGEGFRQGTQSQLSFLPERHTDFVFSVFAEEWGFAGCCVLLLGYLFLILWGIYIARRAADEFGMYLAVGTTAMLFWHIFINLCMVVGMMPVVGVPLPLFSYGGTSMITTMIGVGLLLNVSMRRFMFD